MATTAKHPGPPADLGDPGAKYWRSVVEDFELDESALELLAHACRQLDRAEAARTALKRDGMTFVDRWGQPRCHPALAEERAAHLAFLRLRRELAIDTEEPSSEPKRGPTPPKRYD